MNTKDSKKYLEEFKAYTREINSSKESASEFYKKAGINTPTGRLKQVYYHTPSKIGYVK